MDLVGGAKQFVFDNVRVPRKYLIAEENKGWMIANTTLELEHGGRGSPGGGEGENSLRVQAIINYLRNAGDL